MLGGGCGGRFTAALSRSQMSELRLDQENCTMDTAERLKQAIQGTARALGQELAGTGGEQGTPGNVDNDTIDLILKT